MMIIDNDDKLRQVKKDLEQIRRDRHEQARKQLLEYRYIPNGEDTVNEPDLAVPASNAYPTLPDSENVVTPENVWQWKWPDMEDYPKENLK